MGERELGTLLLAGPWRQRLRWALRLITPWGLEWWWWRRARRLSELRMIRETPRPEPSVEEAFRFLAARGLDEHQVRAGSMPGESLRYLREAVVDRLPRDRPVRALHIGNFVGVSLCFVTWLVRGRHPDSVVVSIDPNLPHRGVPDPEDHLRALLEHFGLLGGNLIIRGYTLEAPGDPPEGAGARRGASEHVLPALKRIGADRFDLVVIDGDHERGYVSRELSAIGGMLADGAIVVLDDIADWEGVAIAFDEALDGGAFTELGRNGRVGVLQRTPGALGAVSEA